MNGVDDELWNIFTFYSLRGNPLDPTRLSVNQFLRLARDCQIVNGGDTASNGGLRAAEANLAFASVIRGRTKVVSKDRWARTHQGIARPPEADIKGATDKSRLTYPEFLDALMVLGERMYQTVTPKRSGPNPSAGGDSTLRKARCKRSVESTFQQLLMDHILPLASRRRPTSAAAAMRDPLVRDLLRHFAPALREVFRRPCRQPVRGGTGRKRHELFGERPS
ncbi:unnamed protein product [Ectocarpus sp. 6 AP-2014]